ncbi:MAG: hypothetical protein VB141_13215 [Burkholderia gladioli]
MRRINTPDGNWQPGDPSTGIKGTIVTRDYMQTVQEELAAVPESIGIKLDPNDNQQLLKGIRKIYTDGIAGGIQTGGRLNGVNSPNLLFNGSGEFGAAGWFAGNSAGIDTNGLLLKLVVGGFGEGTFWAIDRDLDGKVGYFVDYSDFVGLGDGVTINLQAELFAGGLTGGNFYIDAEFYDDASPPKILGQSQQLKATHGAGWTYLSASFAVPRGTRKLRIRKVLDGNPKGTRGAIACRRIKLESGPTPSLYSQEADFLRVALLDSPALIGTPTAPTQDAKDNSTRLATTAFVQALSGTYATQQWVKNYAINKAGDTIGGTLYSKGAKYDAGVYRVTADIGGAFADWTAARSYAVQVDAPTSTAAYGICRVTRWGGRHLAAIDVYEGGSATTDPTIVYHIGVRQNAWTFSGTDISRGGGGSVWGSWNFDPGSKANSADLTWTNGQLGGKANAGARVQWDSGVNNFGTIDRVNGALPAPWVVCGLGGPGNGTANAITVYGIVLRNQ